MPLGNWNLEWLNLNSQRKYPLADDASGEADSGFVLPNDFIVGLDLAVHAGYGVTPNRFFVFRIGAYATGYSVVVGYQPASGDPVPVATALIARQSHERNKTYNLGGMGDFDDARGKITVGRLDSIDKQPAGFHSLTFGAGRLDPDAVRPIIRGVSSLTVVSGGQRSRPITGDVELVAGENFAITTTTLPDGTTRITLSAVSGEGTVEDCPCVEAASPPIKTINGIAPTADGDFFLVGDKCVETTAEANGVRITDQCSAPCCGCAELEAITRDLERLKREAASVASFADKLGTSVSTMDLVVLGARLGDRGTCG